MYLCLYYLHCFLLLIFLSFHNSSAFCIHFTHFFLDKSLLALHEDAVYIFILIFLLIFIFIYSLYLKYLHILPVFSIPFPTLYHWLISALFPFLSCTMVSRYLKLEIFLDLQFPISTSSLLSILSLLFIFIYLILSSLISNCLLEM